MTQNLMLYALPAISFVVMVWQPAAIQLVFAATSLSQILIATLLKQPAVRGRLGIAQLPKATAQSQQRVMQEIQDMWKSRKPKDNTPPPIPRSEKTIYMSEAKAAQDRLRKAKLEQKRSQRRA
jgi:YidC/Oxa1 family membrane protein insertase